MLRLPSDGFLGEQKEMKKEEATPPLCLDTVMRRHCLELRQPFCGHEGTHRSRMAEWKSRKKLVFTDITELLKPPLFITEMIGSSPSSKPRELVGPVSCCCVSLKREMDTYTQEALRREGLKLGMECMSEESPGEQAAVSVAQQLKSRP